MADSPGLLSLSAPGLSIQIDPLGAELHSLRDAQGRDLLWDGDPAVWSGRAPLLFPIVGALANGRFHWRGQDYTLPRHGFARRRLFEVVERTASEATLRLTWDQETLAVYPFRFALDVTFSLADATLAITTRVRNLGDDVLYASFGFHPAFRWPLPGAGAREDGLLRFEQPEPEPVRRLDAQGLLRAASKPSPVIGRDLALRDGLFVDDALIFDRLSSRRLVYGGAQEPRLEIAFPDAHWLGVWTKPGAGFICIEPWAGVADPEGFDGELPAKPGIFAVAPGQAWTFAVAVTLRSDGAG